MITGVIGILVLTGCEGLERDSQHNTVARAEVACAKIGGQSDEDRVGVATDTHLTVITRGGGEVSVYLRGTGQGVSTSLNIDGPYTDYAAGTIIALGSGVKIESRHKLGDSVRVIC